jgi:DNA mismatch repair protein MutS
MKYGNKTFLLMQVGSFYEVYGLEDELDDINEYGNICNLMVVKKKEKYNKKNVYMAGFRDYMLESYLMKLKKCQYTTAVCKQITVGKKEYKRVELGIFSPGTIFSDEEQRLTNNITCLWIHKTSIFNQNDYIFGICNIDIFTGEIRLSEFKTPYYHNPTTYDNIERLLTIYNPLECLIVHNIGIDILDNILNYINIKSKKIHMVDINNSSNKLSIDANKCMKQNYQNEILKKYYPHVQLETFKYSLFEKIVSFQSFCFLIEFIEQHNSSLINRLLEPIIDNQSQKLVLANHSLKQLNILDNDTYSGPYSSVLKLINTCKTKMGKRELNNLLLNPITNVYTLNETYDIMEHIIKKKYNWNSYLVKIKDIEKIIRKINLKKASPIDYSYLYDSLLEVQKLLKCIKKDKILTQFLEITDVIPYLSEIIYYLDSVFDMNYCRQITCLQFEKFSTINHLFIKKENCKELDDSVKEKIENNDKIQAVVDFLNTIKIEKKNTRAVKIQETTNGICLITTKRRGKMLLEEIKKINSNHNIEFVSNFSNKTENFELDLNEVYIKEINKSSVCITCPCIQKMINSILTNESLFYKIIYSFYESIHNTFLDYYSFSDIVKIIRNIDVLNTKCEISVQYNYTKPIIKENNNVSFMNVKKVRHPLIEHLDKNELYVSNDINMDEKNRGLLLFGTNAVGKTSFIKSIGICIIMAQAGMYVPCDFMEYYPYEYIFTRILGNDNIFKGLSTFGVEMSELRVILNNCNQNSLILGDELCSGTEIDSALSIFISSLQMMYEKKSSFLFATHFHQIQYYDEITKMEHLSLKHMRVLYNNEKQELVYDRKLQDGAGSSEYGLEVCKSLDMPYEFLNEAYKIRKKYDNHSFNVLSHNTTKYNRDKIKGMCEFCNKNKAQEIHHLEYQQKADDLNYICNENSNFHKNHYANLASICSKCHNHIHALGLVYHRKKTSSGYDFILSKIE